MSVLPTTLSASNLPPMKILKIPKRNQAEKIDWLQKIGNYLSQKEAQEKLNETSETILNDIEDFRGIMALKDQSNIDTLFVKDNASEATK